MKKSPLAALARQTSDNASWNFKTDANVRHIGPMAQDFYASFCVGTDDKHISTVDEGGVALAAIQGLNEKLEARTEKWEKENAELKKELNELKQLINNSRHGVEQ